MNAAWLRRRWLVAGTLFAALLIAVGSFALAEALRYQPGADAHRRSRRRRSPPSTTAIRRARVSARWNSAAGSRSPRNTNRSAAFPPSTSSPTAAISSRVTDHGSWLRGRIVYRDGKPAGIADAEMAPMLAWDGKPLAAHRWYDAESLTELDGQLYVGIERVEKIVRFDYRRDGLAARGKPIKVPDDFKTFTYNKSLECLAAPPKGSPLAGQLIVVTEHSLDAQGNHRSYILDGNRVARFSVKRSDDFDVSDCTILPPADLLLLERRFSLLRGLAMRIRRIPLASIKPDTLIDGKPLIVADLAYQIDNMEGIAVHTNAAGETILTLVSDDNFSVIQRNLLLQFALVGE